MPTGQSRPTSALRKAQAYAWFGWGVSLCYWGVRTSERSFFESGVRAFDRATHLWPEYAQAFYRRGNVRGRELGAYAAAIADLSRASALEPTWPEPLLQRGLLQRFHGDPRAALADLQRYLDLGGGSWRAEAERQIAALRQEVDEQGEQSEQTGE